MSDFDNVPFNHVSRFTTHAIESLAKLHRFVALHHAHALDDLPETIQLMREAQKFVLPFEGELVDMKTYRPEYAPMLRLPFPAVSLEFPTRDSTEGSVLKSTKMIILAWTNEYETDFRMPGTSADTVYFTNVWLDDEQGEWEPSPVVWGFVPSELETSENGEFVLSGFRHFAGHVNAYKRLGEGEQRAAFLEHELSTLVKPLFEFCLTVNCQNVTTAVIPPPEKLQKKRLKNGKEPLYTYHVLQLPQQGSEGGGHGLGYDRTGPRVHWRRGHLRRLQTGHVIWVRPAIVGNAERGLVDKTYRVTES